MAINLAKKYLQQYRFDTDFLDRVPSTSQFLKDKLKSENKPDLRLFCNALEQSAGYGQRQRSWFSSEQSLKFSLAFSVANDLKKLFPASLHLALLLREILSFFHAEQLKVKWPNDIYSAKGKVCGILTEVVNIPSCSVSYVVIGIGINVGEAPINNDFKADVVVGLDINNLLELLLPKITQIFNCGEKDNLNLLAQWHKVDFFTKDCPVIISDGKVDALGVYKGLSNNYMPRVQIDNQIVEYKSANISLTKVLDK
jgi:BirA family biotin operon repressor/biotin-[acetyl-CoA-carboxylase] ligase